MKDFEKLIKECEADLASIGISIGNVVKYSINTRAKSRWGQCKSVGENKYEIDISQRLLTDDISDQAAKDTILHEMLHTVEGGMGHKGKWKELAQKVNRELPQYTIKRVTSNAEKGIKPAEEPKETQRIPNRDRQKHRYAQEIKRNLPFFLSVACFFGYAIILSLCLCDIYGGGSKLHSDDAVILMLSQGYLPQLLFVAAVGVASSVISIRKCKNALILNISKAFCLLFFLLAFFAINIALD